MVIDETIYGNDNPLWKHCPANAAPDRVESGGEDICFLTCIFGDNIGDVDRPANVEWFDNYWCHTRFLLVTNLPGLPAPGWTKIVANTTKDSIGNNIAQNQMTNDVTQKQHIVRSRHAKFLAWEALPEIAPKHCASVVYMDGYLIPVRYTSWWTLLSALVGTPPWSPASPLFLGSFPWNRNNQIPPPAKFQTVVRQVKSHPWGLSQVKQKYFDGLPMTTLLNNLVRDRKDTREHVETTLEWFRTQTTDFQEIMPYYLNKYFGEWIVVHRGWNGDSHSKFDSRFSFLCLFCYAHTNDPSYRPTNSLRSQQRTLSGVEFVLLENLHNLWGVVEGSAPVGLFFVSFQCHPRGHDDKGDHHQGR